MLKELKKILFDKDDNLSSIEEKKSHQIEIATCALFIELAKSDNDFSEQEKIFITNLMKMCFDLSDEELSIILKLAEEKVDKSVSIYEFTGELNEKFSQVDKEKLIRNLWRLIYTDKKLHSHEDSIIKKIALTLNIEHKKIIELKLQVKRELNID